MGICRLRGAINFFARGIKPAEKDVVVDSIVKQKRLLCHETEFVRATIAGVNLRKS